MLCTCLSVLGHITFPPLNNEPFLRSLPSPLLEMKQPLVFSGVQAHLGTTWSVFHGFGMGCHGRCCSRANAEGPSSTGTTQECWHGILFNENNCVDSIGNQNPFSLPAGSGSYLLCQSSSVSLLPASFYMWGIFWGKWFSLCTLSVCWRSSALLLPFCCQQLISDTDLVLIRID